MSERQVWWNLLDKGDRQSPVEGLTPVKDYVPAGRPPEEVIVMEKARDYGADAVFFAAGTHGRPQQPQALIFVDNSPPDDEKFAKLHQKLWSWGGVPLVYRKTRGRLDLFRCAHGPDFFSVKTGKFVCNPVRSLELASAISDDPWWDIGKLRNGTLWDDDLACKTLLSSNSAHKGLIDAVKRLSITLKNEKVLQEALRRRLLILSLLIAYLEQRQVFEEGYLGTFLHGATRFFEVLANGPALVSLLKALEDRFNGHVFKFSDPDLELLRNSQQLDKFSRLIEGREDAGGQLTLWELYSFNDLPIELISHIYELFVKNANSSVYTPPFLVRLMLEETLDWERLDRLHERDEVILDPACGSGVFLVEAYKRLVLHWRSKNGWERPNETTLKKLLDRVHGIDLEAGAVELAAFSLCLALCDALEPKALRESIKLFPLLKDRTLHHSCFFEAKERGLIKCRVGVAVGNPPFASSLDTPGAQRSYENYQSSYGLLPDKQVAYLFLHEVMEVIVEGGVLSMLQQYNFIYNQQSLEFRRRFFSKWDVREVLDFISVRGLFQADTKTVVVIAEAACPPENRKILHATFRRTGRVKARLGFDIDYYDLHWLPRELVLQNDAIWRANLLGGGRVLGLIDRLQKMRSLGQLAESEDWDFGEGFIEGSRGVSKPADHIIGKPLLPSEAVTLAGIDESKITIAQKKPIEGPRSGKRFTPPMLLVREQMNLPHGAWFKSYMTYKNQLVGFCGRPNQQSEIRKASDFLAANRRALQAFVAATSVKLFTQHATTLSGVDVTSLPFPESGTLDLSDNEQILVDDVVDYYRDLVRLGEKSPAMTQADHSDLKKFSEVFADQINAVYRKKPATALEPQVWSGVICQPFVFGMETAPIDWNGAAGLEGKIYALLHEKQESALRITRVCRIYDGPFIFVLKPDRLRYWLRSTALRDADETLSDLRAQGF